MMCITYYGVICETTWHNAQNIPLHPKISEHIGTMHDTIERKKGCATMSKNHIFRANIAFLIAIALLVICGVIFTQTMDVSPYTNKVKVFFADILTKIKEEISIMENAISKDE